jgi:hypothetical protein
MLFLLRKKPLPMIRLRNRATVKPGRREDGEEGKKTEKRLRRRRREDNGKDGGV